ncbi:hypothetical protein HMPREF9413_0227 [Paenibacillus sp. HGF7]|nr:hypothetical protein HMPREF9413_0227 [Paenibacillus sp. HGF7]
MFPLKQINLRTGLFFLYYSIPEFRADEPEPNRVQQKAGCCFCRIS